MSYPRKGIDGKISKVIADTLISSGCLKKEMKSIYDLSKSIDNMTQTLTPILESNTVTFRTLLRNRMAQWKKWPRWKNPYTYMYVFIGLLFMFVFTVALVRNRKLQEENAIARSIINEYIIVDIVMSENKAYQKERTQIHESIQKYGFYVTWEEVCRLRAENP